MTLKLDLPRSIPLQIAQGQRVATMSDSVLVNKTPVLALQAANNQLQVDQAAALIARKASADASAKVKASSILQRSAYGALAAQVGIDAEGSESFILSTGYGVRATPVPTPALTEPPANVATRINGVPGRVGVTWAAVFGARNYEVQYTTDLTGVTGWTTASTIPGPARINIDGLTSGTRYAFRVRALGNDVPGPWSGPVQQIAA